MTEYLEIPVAGTQDSVKVVVVNHGTLTLHLIKIVSEELLIIRLIPYLCCLKEEKADRKGNLFRGQQSFRVYEPS